MSKDMLSKLMDEIHLGMPVQFRDLCIFPVFRTPVQLSPAYLSMEAALGQKVLELKEMPGGGTVSRIIAANLAPLPVLLLDGQALIGGKQNRIINTSILLASKEELLVPVSCVEQGRWRQEKSTVFSHADEIMPAEVRHSKSRQVHNNMKTGRGFSANQQEIWKNVAALNAFHRVDSPTQSMQAAFLKKQTSIGEYVEAFEIQENQTGLIVFRAGRFAGFDYVSLPSVYQDLHVKFLKSHVMEAITRPQSATVEEPKKSDVTSLLEHLSELPFSSYDALGLGVDHRFDGQHYSAALLTYHEQVIHWTAFPKRTT